MFPAPRNTYAIMPKFATIKTIHQSLDTLVVTSASKHITVEITVATPISVPPDIVNATALTPSILRIMIIPIHPAKKMGILKSHPSIKSL
jgi:hypothetical protein